MISDATESETQVCCPSLDVTLYPGQNYQEFVDTLPLVPTAFEAVLW